MNGSAVKVSALIVVTLMVVGVSLAGATGTAVSIGSGSSEEGGTDVVSLILYNVTDLGYAGINLTYNASVVDVTAVTNSDFTDVKPNLYTKGLGWVLLQAGQFQTGLNGNVKMCDVTLQAVGKAGDTSPLNLTDLLLEMPMQMDRKRHRKEGPVYFIWHIHMQQS